MVFRPDPTSGLEVYVNADFVGNWNKDDVATDQDTACSQHSIPSNTMDAQYFGSCICRLKLPSAPWRANTGDYYMHCMSNPIDGGPERNEEAWVSYHSTQC